MSKVSIIIPFYNKFHLTAARLQELYMYAPEGHEVILVNDGSTDDVASQVAYWQKMANCPFKVRYTVHTENMGFPESMNHGARMAKGDVLVFLSNDVEIGCDFIDPILNKINDTMLIGARIIDWKAGWNEFVFGGKPMIVPYLEGWFIAATRTVWDDLGGFDPRYSPYCVEDIDLSATAVHKGYKLELLYPNLLSPKMGAKQPLRHIGAQSVPYGGQRDEITKLNKEKFIRKWEGILSEQN